MTTDNGSPDEQSGSNELNAPTEPTTSDAPASAGASAPQDDQSAVEFPHKLRVHALARLLGVTSRQVLGHLADLGVTARSAQSSIDRNAAVRVRDILTGQAEAPAADSPADTTESQATGTPSTESEPTEPESTESESTGPETAEPVSAQPSTGLFSAVVVEEPVAPTAAGEVGQSPLFLPPSAEAVHAEREARARRRAESGTTSEKTPPAGAGEPVAGSDRDGRDEDDERDERQSSGDQGADDHGTEESNGSSRRRRRGRRGRGRGRGDQNGPAGDDSAGDHSAEEGGEPQNRRDTVDHDSAGASGHDADDDTTTDDADGDLTTAESTGAQSRGGRHRSRSRNRHARSGDDSASDADDSGESAVGGSAASHTSDVSDDAASDEKNSGDTNANAKNSSDKNSSDKNTGDDEDEDGSSASSRRRRRRRRRKGGEDGDEQSSTNDDPPNTVVHEREPRNKARSRDRDEVQGISGSTRLEAKRQRRRDGRDAGRRRPPILSESEFLARREAVDRVMVVRERAANGRLATTHAHEHDNGTGAPETSRPIEDYTQIAVLEDGVLVEHFVTTSTSQSMVGNIYLGRVQNVLPGMEAAFVDIGRGRNGVLYAGEVNWDAAGLDGGSRKIEQALKPGDEVLVQVSKDPVGHKGARLTTQISLAGRYLVYVPGGSSTGISRKLPDVERKRLKQILGHIVPDNAGVIIRTASEGVSEEELTADIERLRKQWESIEAAVRPDASAQKSSGGKSGSGKSGSGKSSSLKTGTAPKTMYEEPNLLVKVVRDLFNEDFKKLVVEGDGSWDLVEGYVSAVAPDLLDRVERFEKPHADSPDVFSAYRIDEQLAKALDRKVWLPSGGTLVIDHTEAMTVIDVNTGKFTGSGGNLEETVTRNNLEAAEEIVRQMRLRDIGGMIIVDFIDMVLESNRDLVLRRLTEALSRDRTRHQVSEVTSLGLVQMTRKRLGTGLLEAFSTTCACCGGRGLIVHDNPVEVASSDDRHEGSGKKSRRSRKAKSEPAGAEAADSADNVDKGKSHHSPAEHPMFRAMAHRDEDGELTDTERGAGDVQDSGATVSTEASEPVTSDASASVTSGDEADQPDESGAADSGASAPQTGGDGQPRGRRRNRGGRGRGDRDTDGSAYDAPAGEHSEPVAATEEPSAPDAGTDGSADSIRSAGPDTAAPTEAVVTESASTGATTTGAASTGPAPTEAVVTRKRRRASRRTAAPSVTSSTGATAVIDTPAAPVTTFGPVGSDSAGAAEPAVAVRRTPRRRAAGRPAGPPQDA